MVINQLQKTIFLFSVSLLFASLALGQVTESLQPEAARASLIATMHEYAKHKSAKEQAELISSANKLKVEKVLGCIPTFKLPPNIFTCVLVGSGFGEPSSESRRFEVPFKFDKGQWQALTSPVRPSPACAPVHEAEINLRKIRKIDSITIQREVDDGEGNFTDERGISRDKKGPYRIMCRYEGQQTFAGETEDRLFISYLWYQDGHYIFDSDVEVWD